MTSDGVRRWRGLKALVHDAVDATTELVREGHESTARVTRRVTDEIPPLRDTARVVDGVRRLSTAGVLGSVKLVNRAVEVLTDAGLDFAQRAAARGTSDARAVLAMPLRADAIKSWPWLGDAALGLVNAAVGDHLATRENGLDLSMVFRVADHYVTLDRETLAATLKAPTPKVALFVHGLATTEWSWCLEAESYYGDAGTSFGTLLARDLGFTAVHVRYNTGRHVSDNGRALAEALERFVAAYPIEIEDLTLIGHSMGGLVARSACHYGHEDGRTWVGLVKRVFCLGSPHRGAPLAKLGHVLSETLGAIDLPGTRITSKILDGRSAGIKDLRHGAVIDEHWLDVSPDDSVPLLPHARYYFVGATVTDDPDHPIGRLIGDLMVQLPSSLGPNRTAPLVETRQFPIETRRYGGVMHHQLQNHPAVYEQLREACTEPGSEILAER